MSRIEKIPVPCIATFLSFLTLGNVYGGLGFVWLRYLIMTCGTVFIIFYILKFAMFSKTCLKEYEQTIPASLYGAFSMVLMVLGSFYYEIGLPFGKIIWFIGVAIHCVQIIVFTIKHAFGKVIIPKDFTNMMPSWFVTYNGWMVACVTGGKMNAGPILKFITIYGCIIYVVLLPFMLWRLTHVEIKNAAYHTMAVLLAPCSLCVVSLINVNGQNNGIVLTFMYISSFRISSLLTSIRDSRDLPSRWRSAWSHPRRWPDILWRKEASHSATWSLSWSVCRSL